MLTQVQRAALTARVRLGREAGPVGRIPRHPRKIHAELGADVGGTVFSYAPLAGELAGTFAVRGLAAPFEVTRRLEQSGAEVSLLALLDAPFEMPAGEETADDQLARRFLADATHSLGCDPADQPGPDDATVSGQLGWLAARLAPDDAGSPRWPGLLSGPVAALPVPGDHYSFLRPPLVAEVATSIEKWHG